MIRFRISMLIPIRIGIKTMPIHNTGLNADPDPALSLSKDQRAISIRICADSFLETTTMMMKLADPDNLNQCAHFMNFYKST